MSARFAFRTTYAPAIGMGHLRRCLTLAQELKQQGASCAFLLTGHPEGVTWIRTHGFSAQPIDGAVESTLGALGDLPSSIVVVDDYEITEPDFSRLRSQHPLAVIDDLADRRLDADVVLNANANASSLHYRAPSDCLMLLGPRYALLRPGFRGLPRRKAIDEVRRVLVTMGGADPARRTVDVTRRLISGLYDTRFDVVLGPLYGDPSDLAAVIRSGGRGSEVQLHLAPDDLAPLMAEADLAVSAGGQTTYELAAAGVPAVAMCVAENQRGNLAALSQVPTLLTATSEELMPAVMRLVGDVPLRQKMCDAAQALVDGQGAVRAAQALIELAAARG
jgi:UDP-2,4-diacetamido-2,4,6-trideoxy-beta-L-altropyranose hydrolase